jgi:hypothetical protein
MILGTVVVLLLFVGLIFGPKALSAFMAFRAQAIANGRAAAKPVPEPILPPLLKESDMIGSVWNVTIKGFTLKVAFNANGQAIASSDNIIVREMAKSSYGVESLPGKWRIEGPKLLVSAVFQGKEYSTALTISGTKLVSKEGVPIVRVR